MQIVRSWLFVPGDQPKMLDKASTLSADVLIYDLEDSVSANKKVTAREMVAGTLAAPSRRALRYVRVGPIGSDQLECDLTAVVRPGLDGLVIPKVTSPADVHRVDTLLTDVETTASLQPGCVKLVATIESTRGLLAAAAIAASCPRVFGLLFGAEDYALDLGALSLRASTCDQMLYARSAIAVAAASCEVIAVDRVIIDFHDTTMLLQDARQARQLGYSGKAIIHPSQIEHVNDAFGPSVEDVQEARQVIELYEAAAAGGTGAAQLDGTMIDLPVVEKARRIVEFAEALQHTGR